MKKLLLLTSAFMLMAFSGLAQKTVSGVVTDESGLPLPGATVIEQGTSNGVSSDFDGNFTIEVAEGATLEVSFVGYTSAVVSADSDNLNISLQPGNALEEVIVTTGYSTVNRSEVTGAIIQVDSEELRSIPTATVDQALQGKVAGLVLSSNSGTPGSSSNIRIRGISSINAGNGPLYVIDGVPVNSGSQEFSGATSFLSSLSAIDSNNIESITVLKDASATAQYGARGSNGVIVITTKSGKSGDTKIQLTSTYGYSNEAVEGPVSLTAAQRYDLQAEAYFNDYPGSFPTLQDAYDYVASDWIDAGRPEANWNEVVLNRDAPIQETNLSASGGDENGTFFASLGYVQQEGIIVGSDFERISGSLNVSRRINDKVTYTSNNQAAYSVQNANLEKSAYFASAVMAQYFMPPDDLPRNEDGSFNENTGVYNPLALLENDFYRNHFLRILSNNALSWETPIKGLTYGLKTNIDYQLYNYRTYEGRNYGQSVAEGGSASSFFRNNAFYVFQNFIDYNIPINDDHVVDIKVLQEFQKQRYFNTYAAGESFADDGLFYLDSAGTPTSAGSAFTDSSVAAYLGLIHYTAFDSKYVVDLSVRREANSRFSADNRWGTFYSAGGAWNIHKESFLEGNETLSNLKLRASYGLTGNANISINQYQALFSFDADYAGEGATYASTFGNSDLSWETSTTFDVGLDFGLFENKIRGNVAYYNRKTEDMLLSVPLSLTTGFSSQTRNIGKMENKGVEVELDWNIIQSEDFNLSIGGNLATNENEVLELAKDGNGDDINITTTTRRVEVGQPVYAWYMPTWAGVDPDNGRNQYYIDRVGGDTTYNFNEAEQVFQGGSAIPTITAGMNIHIDYKNFALDASGLYQGGHKVYESWHRYLNQTNAYPAFYYQGLTTLLDRWRQPGDIARNSRATAGGEPWQRHSKFLYDGDFMRLRNVSLTYTFPSDAVEPLGLDGLSFFVRGTNLLTWVKDDNLVYDPEIQSDGFTGLETPPTKSVILGVNIKL